MVLGLSQKKQWFPLTQDDSGNWFWSYEKLQWFPYTPFKPFKPSGWFSGEGPAVPPRACPGPSAWSGMLTRASPTSRPGASPIAKSRASLWPPTRDLQARVWKDSLFNIAQVVVKHQMRVVQSKRKIRREVYHMTNLYHILVWMIQKLPLQTLQPLQSVTLLPSTKEPIMVEKLTNVTPNNDDLV